MTDSFESICLVVDDRFRVQIYLLHFTCPYYCTCCVLVQQCAGSLWAAGPLLPLVWLLPGGVFHHLHPGHFQPCLISPHCGHLELWKPGHDTAVSAAHNWGFVFSSLISPIFVLKSEYYLFICCFSGNTHMSKWYTILQTVFSRKHVISP